MHQNALLTNNLDPPRKYVPWYVAQGVHSDDITKEIKINLFNFVCSNYTGPNKSPACPKTDALSISSPASVDLTISSAKQGLIQTSASNPQ